MNNKKTVLIVVILILILILGVNLYENKRRTTESPVITMNISNGTSNYTIKYYRNYATYREDIDGIAGITKGEEKKITYTEKVDFKQ